MFKKLLPFAVLTVLATSARAQETSPAAQAEYDKWVTMAYELYDVKKFRDAGDAYTKAFAALDGKATPDDRYNAACCWSLAKVKDSAFYHLDRLVSKNSYSDIMSLQADADLKNLYADARWKKICAQVKQNKEKVEANLNRPLVAKLDTILQSDQKYRKQLGDVGAKYGEESKQMEALWGKIHKQDSINTLKVTAILDKYGWLGKDVIGERGNGTLFLVIQHARLAVQDKYLPMMRDAVKNGRANGSDIALLEDRVGIRHGGKQVYGSQVISDSIGALPAPMIDPDQVDARRASVGLEPMSVYMGRFGAKWDLETYKQRLAALEKAEEAEKARQQGK